MEEEIEYKVCTVCREKKLLTAFHKRKEVKDGHRSICKACRIKYSRRWYELNREQVLGQTNKYYHKNKKKRQEYLHENKDQISKKRKQFYRENKERLSKWQKQYRHENKEQLSERDKQYRHRNRERLSKQSKQYYHENKEEICKRQKGYRQSERGYVASACSRHRRRTRIETSKVDLTPEQWARILKNQQYRCNLCGKKFTKRRPPTMDHIIPLSKGGGLTSSNVQALCKPCNCKKQATILKRFIASWTILGASPE